jgi:GntR family transcriptional regulator
MMLNQESPLPLYFQLYKIIRQKIDSEEYKKGEKIPSENELASSFGIGRPTVRQACERLIREGLLEKRRGSGSFVTSGKKEISIFSLAGTSAAFLEKGIKLEQKLIDSLSLIETDRDEKNPFAGSVSYFFSRISMDNKDPVLCELIYLDKDIFGGLEKYELGGVSIARTIEEYFFMKPIGGNQSFSVSFLSGKYATAMNVDGKTPLLLVRRTLHFKQKDNAIYSDLYFRTDRFEFSQELGGLLYG